ncbi:MAG: hypothetical protein ACXVAX_09490, partial [Pseudobdellovibrio sp.]
MFVKVQEEYKSQVLQTLQNLEKGGVAFELVTHPAQSATLVIGNYDFLSSEAAQRTVPNQVLILDAADTVTTSQVHGIAQKSPLIVAKKNEISKIEDFLKQVKQKNEKAQQVATIKNEIQRKRKQLEELNNQLTSESEKKIQFLEKSHIEETEKNQNEKSLLHFLDFIQSESVSDDFPEKLFRFIWKDLKKIGRVYTLGMSHVGYSGKSKITFYDGIDETTLTASLDFKSGAVSNQLAGIWGRPVGKVLHWPLPENSRPAWMFLEVVDRQTSVEKIDAYFNERLAVLSMYLDRWM